VRYRGRIESCGESGKALIVVRWQRGSSRIYADIFTAREQASTSAARSPQTQRARMISKRWDYSRTATVLAPKANRRSLTLEQSAQIEGDPWRSALTPNNFKQNPQTIARRRYRSTRSPQTKHTKPYAPYHSMSGQGSGSTFASALYTSDVRCTGGSRYTSFASAAVESL
jgi:hypothetical protein